MIFFFYWFFFRNMIHFFSVDKICYLCSCHDDSILYAVPDTLIKYHQKKNISLSSNLLCEDVSLTLLSCTKSLTILVKQSNLSSRTSLWDLNFYRSQYNHETLVIDIVENFIKFSFLLIVDCTHMETSSALVQVSCTCNNNWWCVKLYL